MWSELKKTNSLVEIEYRLYSNDDFLRPFLRTLFYNEETLPLFSYLISGGVFTLFAAEDLGSSRHGACTKAVRVFRVEILDVTFQAALGARLVITVWANMLKVYGHMLVKVSLGRAWKKGIDVLKKVDQSTSYWNHLYDPVVRLSRHWQIGTYYLFEEHHFHFCVLVGFTVGIESLGQCSTWYRGHQLIYDPRNTGK